MISGGGVFYPITITDGVYDITNNQRLSTTLTGKADKATTYTKTEVDNIVGDCAYIGDDDGSTVMVDPPITPESMGFGIGTCSTAAGTAAKVVTLANYELVVNGFVAVSFVEDVPANATLNINGAGAKPIFYKGEAIVENAISGGDTVTFVYDGTNYVVATPLRLSKVTIRTWSDNAKTTPVSALLNITLPGKPASQVRIGVTGTVTLYSLDGNATISCFAADLDINSFIVNGDVVVDVIVTNRQYVDLGLPSGILWAKYNIDVKQTDGFAVNHSVFSYFSWGNTDGHNLNGNSFENGYSFTSESYANSPGSALSGNISLSYDAARINLGEPWRMPTPDEYRNLISGCDFIDQNNEIISGNNKCITIDGVTGILMRSKTNNNTIFFPLTGEGYSSGVRKTDQGFYWDTKVPSYTREAMFMITSSSVGLSSDARAYGYAIRAVM